MFALGSLYALAHFFLKKAAVSFGSSRRRERCWRRICSRIRRTGRDSQVHLAPLLAVSRTRWAGTGLEVSSIGASLARSSSAGRPGYAPPASAAAPTYVFSRPARLLHSQHNPYAPRPQGGAPVGSAACRQCTSGKCAGGGWAVVRRSARRRVRRHASRLRSRAQSSATTRVSSRTADTRQPPTN